MFYVCFIVLCVDQIIKGNIRSLEERSGEETTLHVDRRSVRDAADEERRGRVS
jgi:hypothetical protein